MPKGEGFEVTVGRQGRLVVPAPLRRRLDIEEGAVLLARAEEGRLVLEPRAAVLSRLRRRFEAVPAGVGLVDELLAARREEAAREREA
jgi:AbrB family looped-hinge helix DNA binding protein